MEQWLSGFIELMKSAKEKESKIGAEVTRGFTPILVGLTESKSMQAPTKIAKQSAGKKPDDASPIPRRTGGWQTI